MKQKSRDDLAVAMGELGAQATSVSGVNSLLAGHPSHDPQVLYYLQV